MKLNVFSYRSTQMSHLAWLDLVKRWNQIPNSKELFSIWRPGQQWQTWNFSVRTLFPFSSICQNRSFFNGKSVHPLDHLLAGGAVHLYQGPASPLVHAGGANHRPYMNQPDRKQLRRSQSCFCFWGDNNSLESDKCRPFEGILMLNSIYHD